TFNLFESYYLPSTTIDQHHKLENELISTRLYILLLIISFVILVFYSSLIRITQTVIVNEPSITKYTQIYERYSQTLSCPCDRISVSYKDIIQIQPFYHQICSSDFIKDQWIFYINNQPIDNDDMDPRDFRLTGGSSFRMLQYICQT
ncbi:unnamed protein product, partial [Didymodactylos carnosus]